MHGGIPFSLTVPESPSMGILDNESLIDALKRYKSVNSKTDFDIAKAEPFIRVINTLDNAKSMRITLQEKSVKIRLNYKGKDIVFDYNFEEPDSVFILSRIDDKLIVKDCKFAEIPSMLESF